MPNCTINDAEFYYELHGSGHPIILIAGYASDHQFCLPSMEALKDQHQVLLLDNRGCGKTHDNGNAFSIRDMAADVMHLADELGLEQPHIIGSSMGGTIAQTIGAQYADKIGKLILVATTAKWRLATKMLCQALLDMRIKEVAPDIAFNTMIASMFGEEMLDNHAVLAQLRNLIDNNPEPQSVADQTRQLDALMAFDGREQLSKITAPTLVINGQQDMIAMPHESSFLAEKIADSELVTFDCGHVISMEKFSEYIAVVKDFLQP